MATEADKSPVIRRLAPGAQTSRATRLADLAERVLALEIDMATINSTVADVKADTAQILSFVEHATGAAGIIKKYGPRAFTFFSGIAVSAGFIDPRVGAFIRSFFA